MTGSPQTPGRSPVVGPGIFGLVTVGMYDDPLAVYREYIQNSADAIASMAALEGGKVEITIDPSGRRIRIWDNGPGLSLDDSLKQLVPIGRSNKRLGSDRGFRGIGRLAGLAFAETVSFTTRARRDEPVTRVTWNSNRLPSSAAGDGEIEDMVRGSVDVSSLPGPEYPDHFFEVELNGVARHSAGSLLNRDAVRSYVSEVCPVPISTAFPYSQRIAGLFKACEQPLSLDITFDGDTEPVRRPYGQTIQLSANREDEFTAFEEIQIPNVDRTADAAVGWIAHSSYFGAIPKGNQIRGVRARVGNIQVGDETVFDSLYSEERFNRWCVGELHILDCRIVPNSRRDYFEPGPHLRNLENHLRPVLRRISGRCRAASTERNKDRKNLSIIGRIEDTYDLAVSGYLTMDYSTDLVRQALQEIPSVREKILASQSGSNNIARLNIVEIKLNDFNGEPEHRPFEDMPHSDVPAYQTMFQALTTVALSPRTAQELMAAILLSASSIENNGTGER